MPINRWIYFKIVAIFTISLFYTKLALAQWQPLIKQDTAYYMAFPNMITTRFYFSQKYTAFTLKAPGAGTDLQYRPNTSLNVGAGATYHNFSLNIAVGVDLLNPDKGKGKTHYLDLQAHFYPEKWSIDLLGQFYKGYYLYPKGMTATPASNYYLRPDLNVHLYGISIFRILNYKKFSYRAAIIQNEWQKKSGGSLLMGAAFNYGKINSDSSLVPFPFSNDFPQAGIKDIHFVSFGPAVGYAYSLVVQKHLFITGSVSVNFNLGFSTEKGVGVAINNTDVHSFSIVRLAAGYNSSSWNISANWVGNQLPIAGSTFSEKYSLKTGNYRFIIAKKIMPGLKLKRQLNKIDRLLK
jgi:hypothetical protein